jgi:Sporulation related domain.
VRKPLIALALMLAACGKSDRAATPAVSEASSASTMRGPDQIVLRFPRDGGQVRAFAYPQLDSVVWESSAKAPGIDRVLGFDGDLGSVAAVDTKGAPVRVDLRMGRVSRDAKPKLAELSSDDGSAIFGIDDSGSVVRLTPAGSWTYEPHYPAREVVPEPDGSLLILADRDDGSILWKIQPPDKSVSDSAILPRVGRAFGTQLGDRIYFTVDSGLVGLRTRDLEPVPSVRLDRPVQALATTPSGDRLYVATDSAGEIIVFDRYTHRTEAQLRAPGEVDALRMDPMGRYVLARATHGDSAWVFAVGTDKLLGTVHTKWRDDLPTVTPDGSIALLEGNDVRLVNGTSLAGENTIDKGGEDSWLFVAWNGFRPRSPGLDEPVTFGYDTAVEVPDWSDDTGSAVSEGSLARRDSGRARPPQTSGGGAAANAPAGGNEARSSGFTVQFAAVRSGDAARDAAKEIKSSGASRARVITTERAGITIYRVVMGPFPTREEAERVARATGKPYWIYEGAP